MLIAVLPVTLLAVILAGDLHAGGRRDLAHGEELHNANCTVCHGSMTGGDGSVLYTRDRRRVNTLEQLDAQVRRCASSLGLKWSEADFADVVRYLNDRYYRFGERG